MIVWKWNLNWNANDSAGSNNWVSTNVTWVDWKMNWAWSFNGTSSKIVIPSWTYLDFTSSYNFNIPIKLNSLPTSWNLYNIYFRANTAWSWEQLEFLIYNNSWTHQIWISHNSVFYTINYTLPTWKYFNINIKYTWWIIYLDIDWVLVWQVTASSQPWSSNKTWCFWANNAANIRYFPWNIDEIIIDNTAWNNAQIKNQTLLYNWFI